MRNKTHQPPKGVKKSGGKVTPAPSAAKPGLTKDAGSFLKQRLGKKVRELRSCAGEDATASASLATASSSSSGAVLPVDLATLGAEASRRGDEFEEGGEGAVGPAQGEVFEDCAWTNPCREVENNRKRFYVELRKVLTAADVIIEVLDARDPAACRSEELEREVVGSGKKLILLLNKIDLVPKEAVEAWIKHLQRSFPAIAFKAAHGASRAVHANVSASKAPEGLLRSTHAVVGADELMQLLKNYARIGFGKTKAQIAVGIVGYPNTGKSSVVNSMLRHTAVETGGRAGVTKVVQEVTLDKKVTLIDSPGVIFEGESDDPSVVLRNVVRVENIVDPVVVVEALVKKAPRQAVLAYYGMNQDFGHVSEFLIHVARARGKLKRGSGLDIPSAARSVISDWTTGKFRYYVLPPAGANEAAADADAETAEMVTSLAPSLDIDALFSEEGEQPVVLGAPPEQADDDAMEMDDGGVEVDMAAMQR